MYDPKMMNLVGAEERAKEMIAFLRQRFVEKGHFSADFGKRGTEVFTMVDEEIRHNCRWKVEEHRVSLGTEVATGYRMQINNYVIYSEDASESAPLFVSSNCQVEDDMANFPEVREDQPPWPNLGSECR